MTRACTLICCLGISLAALAGPVTLQVDKTAITEGDAITCTVTRAGTRSALTVKYAVGLPKVHITAVSASSTIAQTIKNVTDGRLDTFWTNGGNSDSGRGADDDTPCIAFTFDQVYVLKTLRIANYAVPGHTFRGVKDALVEVSTDGNTFTTFGNLKFRKGPDAKESVFEDVSLHGTPAKVVRLTVKTNHAGKEYGKGTSKDTGGSLNGSFVGLNEVEFYTSGASTDDAKPLSGAILIPDGQVSASFQVQTINDQWIEGPENLQVRLLPDTHYSLGTPSSAMIAVADNDTGDEVSITATTPIAFEMGQKPGIFTLKRTGKKGNLVVHYTTYTRPIPITAANCSDFRQRDGAVVEKAFDGDLRTCWYNNGNALSESEGIDDPWIIFTFDKVYTVGKMRIANFVSAGGNHAGIKDVEVLTATGMATFISQGRYTCKRNPDKVTVSEFETLDLGGVKARRVMFNIQSNYSTEFSKGTSLEKYPSRSIVGLAEVEFLTGSTATNKDYIETLTGAITIPDGQDSVTLTIIPVDDKEKEGDETVVITLIPDFVTYAVSAQHEATVTITDGQTLARQGDR